MSPNAVVVKVSGHELDDATFLTGFTQVIRELGQPCVIVHGGGREITDMQKRMGIEAQYVDGLRITDADSLALVEMVLCGVINKRLVRLFFQAGVDALGMSGVDRGLIRADQMQHPTRDMGFTGVIRAVRGDLLLDLLAAHVTPVIAPVCMGAESSLNVNADHVAGAVAAAIGAQRVVFLTNVPGLLVNGQVVELAEPHQVKAWIDDGTIFGGMIPKVNTALAALDHGAKSAVITNLDGLRAGTGTTFRLAEG